MTDQDISTELQQRVAEAAEAPQPLRIRAGGSKDFYGRMPAGELLDVSPHRGITNHEPTELVITARAGTPLVEIEQALAARNQMLPFEPPHFGDAATLGGTIACNLSGPRRPYAGAARDFVLGTRVLNGRGEILRFGGEVMKNVAGYDISRLMCGALGTLGLVLEVSLKVLPRPEREVTLTRQADSRGAIDLIHAWAQKPFPISATCFDGDALNLRLSGETQAVDAARKAIGGDIHEDGDTLWRHIQEHRHPFFQTDRPLWRLSLASDHPPIAIDGEWLYEWGGAQRWLLSEVGAATIREAAARAGGHATQYRGGDRNDVFHPLSSGLMAIHRKLKQAFDPQRIFNPGRMYADL